MVTLYVVAPIVSAVGNTHSINLVASSSQHMSAADSSSLSIAGNITVEAWIKPSSLPNGQTMIIASKTNPQSDINRGGWIFMLTDVGGGDIRLQAQVSDGASVGSERADNIGLTNLAAPAFNNTWVHVAFDWVAGTGNRPHVYINGVDDGSFSSIADSNSILNSSVPLYLGALSGTSGFFDGLVDEVRVWNIARGAVNISTSLNQELAGNEFGLAAYWKLNSDGAVDYTTNGNNFTNVNSATYSTDTPFSPVFTEILRVRKLVDESVIASNVIQDDDQLKLGLVGNKTYIVDGVIFVSATNGTPDIKINFSGQPGTTATIGYTNETAEEVLENGVTSSAIPLVGNTKKSIHIHGTIVTGATGGDFQLKWAQNTSNANNPTTVLKGSYLRVQEI